MLVRLPPRQLVVLGGTILRLLPFVFESGLVGLSGGSTSVTTCKSQGCWRDCDCIFLVVVAMMAKLATYRFDRHGVQTFQKQHRNQSHRCNTVSYSEVNVRSGKEVIVVHILCRGPRMLIGVKLTWSPYLFIL